jgi:hypothetical protein
MGGSGEKKRGGGEGAEGGGRSGGGHDQAKSKNSGPESKFPQYY